eukprot:GSA25T00002928001.1
MCTWANNCIAHPGNTSAKNSFFSSFAFFKTCGWDEGYFRSRLRKECAAINRCRAEIGIYMN